VTKTTPKTPHQAKPAQRSEAKAPQLAPEARQLENAPQRRNRKAKGTSFPFPVEMLNLGRPSRNLPEDVPFVEDWLAVPGAREAESTGRAVLKPTDFHELEPGKDGQRFIVVPGSHEGGAALARAAMDRLFDFFRVVHSDSRWEKARLHPEIHTLAKVAFFAQHDLEIVLSAFELTNKGPELSPAEKRRLDTAVKAAKEVVERLRQSEQFKASRKKHAAAAKKNPTIQDVHLAYVANKRKVFEWRDKLVKRGMRKCNQATYIVKKTGLSATSVRSYLRLEKR
jgi:hypothetical protein